MSTPTTRLKLLKYDDQEFPWGPGVDTNWDILDGCGPIGGLAVALAETPSTTLRVKVNAGTAEILDGSGLAYGGTVLTLVATATTCLWLDNASTLQTGASYPAWTTAQGRLATVTTDATKVTGIVDDRITVAVSAQTPAPTELANTFYRGPTSGAPAAATWGVLVAADIPAISAALITSGTLPLTLGGTGATTQLAAAIAVLPSQAAATGKFLQSDGTNPIWVSPAGSGTVTSVNLNAPAMFVTSGGPITGSGTLVLTFATVAANLFLVGPTTGAAAVPTQRAMVFADMPVSGITAGAYTSINATVNAQGVITAIANGGAGGGAGTVTSVNVTAFTGITVSGGPITGSGTIVLATTLSGVLKGNGTGFVVATAGTDYLTPSGNGSALTALTGANVSGNIPGNAANVTGTVVVANGGTGAVTLTGLLKGNGTLAFTAATAGTDYLTPSGNGSLLTALNATQLTSGTVPTARQGTGVANNTTFLRGDQTWVTPAGSGTVTSVNVASFAGITSSGGPITGSGTITLSTTLSGVLKGNGTGFVVATAGTDYLAPAGDGSGLTNLTAANIAGGVTVIHGGTGLSAVTLGDTLYASATNKIGRAHV